MTFTWTYVNFTTTELIIDLNFDYPSAISAANKDKEFIEVTLHGTPLFRDTNGNYIQPHYELK